MKQEGRRKESKQREQNGRQGEKWGEIESDSF